MKVTLEFDDKEEAQVAIDGEKWRALCFEYVQEMRRLIKHGDGNTEEQKAYEFLHEVFLNMMEESRLAFT